MITSLRQYFRTPSAAETAHAELEEARRGFLSAQTARDYAAAITEYERMRIRRLEEFLVKEGTP
jgi:hypothetical protein